MDSQYTSIARLYDRLNTSVDYPRLADFLLKKVAEHSKGNKVPSLLLDLACGTGKLTSELARRRYDMTGIDLSPDMLDIARLKAFFDSDIYCRIASADDVKYSGVIADSAFTILTE